ncbi:MAG: hypothetical protein EFT35_08225 [Methanophagales archaeon ANME-1-THS]|nr:MAG: hypothetical protein EFT35_08225 [Methanophagales archaeon ANME-1-THS]
MIEEEMMEREKERKFAEHRLFSYMLLLKTVKSEKGFLTEKFLVRRKSKVSFTHKYKSYV